MRTSSTAPMERSDGLPAEHIQSQDPARSHHHAQAVQATVGELDLNLVDLSIKESVAQLDPQGRTEAEE